MCISFEINGISYHKLSIAGHIKARQGLPSSNFFPYKSSYHFQYLNCCQILYSNGTDLKLGSSTYFFLLFSFLVFTKCQILNVRVGRSLDQVLQRAHRNTLRQLCIAWMHTRFKRNKTYQLFTFLDCHLSPEILNRHGNGFTMKSIRWVPHQTHSD